MAKFVSALCFLLGALAPSTIFFVPGCSSTSSSSSFVGRRDTQFVLDGSPFLFNGFNSYWMMHAAAEPAERARVSTVLLEAAAAGLTVGRTWAFSDGAGDRALQVSPGVYDERVFQGLDFVISEAKKNGIRLILSLVNNFKNYGGRAQYVEWARDVGVAVDGEDDFYTNPVVKGYYKKHVEKVLTRFNTITKIAYKDDPTILAWELINEPRCQADYSGKTVHAWVQEMASYVKFLDKKHMLEIGMEGFYGDSTPEKKQYNPDNYHFGTDYISSNLLDEVDFATIHAYPDIWFSGQTDASRSDFLQRWMWSHWNDAVTILQKPLALAEFGLSTKDPGYSENRRDGFFDTVYSGIYKLAKTGGGSFGGGLAWQLMAEEMESYYDGYEIVLSKDPSTNAVLVRQSRAMSALAQEMNSGAAATAGGVRDEEDSNGHHVGPAKKAFVSGETWDGELLIN